MPRRFASSTSRRGGSSRMDSRCRVESRAQPGPVRTRCSWRANGRPAISRRPDTPSSSSRSRAARRSRARPSLYRGTATDVASVPFAFTDGQAIARSASTAVISFFESEQLHPHAHGAPQARHPPEGQPRGPAPGSPADPAGPIVDRQRRRLRRRLAGVGRSRAGDRRSRPPQADRHLRARSARDVRGRRGDARPARGDDLRERARARVHLCAGGRAAAGPGVASISPDNFVARRGVRGRQEQRRVPRSDRLPRADDAGTTSMRMRPRRA